MTFRTSPASSITAIILVLFMGLLLVMKVMTQQELHLVYPIGFGYAFDYKDFYIASLQFLDGISPYSERRFVTPPLPAALNTPLVMLPFPAAARLFSVVTLCMLCGAILTAEKHLAPWRKQRDWKTWGGVALLSLVIVLFSYPFYFVFDRGNIEGVVLFIVVLGLSQLQNRPLLAGSLLALAMALKIYPALILMPLLLYRHWKVLFSLCGAMLLLFLLMPDLWMEFFQQRLLTRSGYFRLDQNGSLAATLFHLGLRLDDEALLARISYLLYLGFLLVVGFADWKSFRRLSDFQKIFSIYLYLPFMLAIPALAYHYELVFLLALLPLLNLLWRTELPRSMRLTIYFLTAGVVLSQLHTAALARMFDIVGLYMFPGIGLLITMVSITCFKIHLATAAGREAAAFSPRPVPE